MATTTHQPLQTNRFELKFIINEDLAAAVRDFAACYLEPDEYARYQPNHSYLVRSLYMDSPDLMLCRSTMNGDKNRFKLRIRVYDDEPGSPAFLETKRRVNEVILKSRAMVSKSVVAPVAAGQWPARSEQLRDSSRDTAATHLFCGLRDRIQARPQAYVAYMREAYVTPNDSAVRVTFDRQLTAGRYDPDFSSTNAHEWHDTCLEGVVLELKFTDRFPNWMRQLVRVFELQRRSMPKYVACMQALKHPVIRSLYQPRVGAL